MGKKINHKKDKLKRKNKPASLSLKESIASFFTNPLNRIIFKFSALILLFYTLWISPVFQTHIVENVALFYARVGGFIIKMFNYPILIVGDTLGYSNFSISIKNGCDAIEATGINWINQNKLIA